ncbi:DCP1A [Bugula neritina]|uniref:DCP1A n=1 Tax=Bugula neritina TaxID=10212 RepID=A0A7J7JCN8_BUGNE|nr:DCP1A [Bugula neritina]
MNFSAPEQKINLATLQHKDPFITNIRANAKHVNLYTYKAEANEWEKTDIEGALFVYARSAPPFYGFMILNQHGTNNFVQPIEANLEFQLQVPFLLYSKLSPSVDGYIYGIWFYEEKVGKAITDHLQRLVKACREASSDSSHERKTDAQQTTSKPQQIDIIQMLNKAQLEFSEKSEPPGVTSDHGDNIVRPQPVKAQPSPNESRRSITIDDLFGKASQNTDNLDSASPKMNTTTAFKRLMSLDQMTTVTELEKEHSPDPAAPRLITPSLLAASSVTAATLPAADQSTSSPVPQTTDPATPKQLHTLKLDKSELLSPMAFSAARTVSSSHTQIPVAINPPQTFNVSSSVAAILGFTSIMQTSAMSSRDPVLPSQLAGAETSLASSLPVTALTKEQLRQALLHMLNRVYASLSPGECCSSLTPGAQCSSSTYPQCNARDKARSSSTYPQCNARDKALSWMLCSSTNKERPL